MHVKTEVVNEMLKNIGDKKLRETYAAIVAGKFPFSVFCMEPADNAHKPGVLIGHIRGDGRTIEEPVYNKDKEVVGALISSRDRFDGVKGFKCACGNSSIVAPEEADIVVPGWLPNQKDMLKLAGRIQKKVVPALILAPGGDVEYGGFKVVGNAA